MFGWIGRLFGRPDRIIRLARGSDRKAFADAFVRADIWLLSIPPGHEEGIDPAAITQEVLMGQIEAAAKDTSERSVFRAFTYDRDGRHFLPLFTAQAYATEFVTQYIKRRKRVIPFAVLQASGATAATSLGDAAVVLNDGTRSATPLSADDWQLVRRAATGRK